MASPLFDLAGRVAVITGISRGIGRALAHGFAEAGAIVVGCARSYEAAERTAEQIRAKGGEALGVLADVTKPEDCQALIDNAVRRYGRLDIAVLNAGINIKKPSIDFASTEFEPCRRKSRRLFSHRPGRGAPIHPSGPRRSHRDEFVKCIICRLRELAPYCAAKAGIDGLVRALAAEWGPHGIGSTPSIPAIRPIR